MPIYQYACRRCAHRFEQLVTASRSPACPACQGDDLERLLSVFAVASGGSREPATAPAGGCGRCGDPRGPGACSLD
jgi:putative FmdB family regulatory protein